MGSLSSYFTKNLSFCLLLTNITHICICLELYCNKHPDPYEQPYYIAQKFNKGQLFGKPLTKAVNICIIQKVLKKQNHTILRKLQNIFEELATTNEKDEDNRIKSNCGTLEDNKNDKEDEENKEYEEDNNNEVLFDLQNP
ncbi:hypothetical protein C2G38_2212197 [Gigaspora rosea]|uniref:Uncharacterized protein n=1 Tax=Gigaspora rosea TaxID=44941 RepID=A0A397ULH8_9GLOM|nr:hypothetical protein C2G38_2212197 [Gigaspora rosea]